MKTVVITGGTKGIGLATGVAFARAGWRCVLTHRMGSADEDAIRETWRRLEAPAPLIVQADASRSDDTKSVFEGLGAVDAIVSNASNAIVVQSLDDLTERGFLKSMRATAWPLVDYLQTCKRVLGAYPRYAIAMSSDGPDRFTPAYDFVAAGKAATESLARYLAYRLRDVTRVNVVRSRAVKTDAFVDTFGSDFYGFLGRFIPEPWFTSPDEVGNAAYALCSGMFDAMTGQVVMVDRGNSFADGISHAYSRTL